MTVASTNYVSAETFSRCISTGGHLDLSTRPKFRLSGNDRVRFLSGQVTQAVSNVSESQTLYACVTNHKGKMEGDLFISGGDDFQSFVLDTDPALGESLLTRLERYIIADAVELSDISADWRLIHVIGKQSFPREFSARAANRYGVAGKDYWLPSGEGQQLLKSFPAFDPRVAEILRIVNGVGRWGAELTPEILPPEARLEARAISYTKGCYIGQEVISRIKSVGRVNRTLERVDWISGDGLAVGMTLFDDQEREVGKLTSAAYHPAHPDGERWIALAFIKRSATGLGTRLCAKGSASPSSNDDQIMLSSVVEVRKTPNHQDS